MSTKRVLVAEDSSIMRMFITNSLKRVSKVEVIEAKNGVEALKVLKEGPVDLVILDVNMPLLNGIEVLRTIRGDAALKEIPVVICTRESDSREVWEKLGATDYLSKPVIQMELNQTVLKYLELNGK
ncbi:MAG TPA: response regulator [Nitrospiria bacterium]|nr:response regulator [Nitrospiria bacterium]